MQDNSFERAQVKRGGPGLMGQGWTGERKREFSHQKRRGCLARK